MTADDLPAAAGDSNTRTNLESIEEEFKEDDTINGDEMEEDELELNENSDLTKAHIIMRFDSNGQNTNVALLVQEVFKWMQEIHPDLYIETLHTAWKTIRSLQDFPPEKPTLSNVSTQPTSVAAKVV